MLFFLIFLIIYSCAYFEKEKDTILPGKRESVFTSNEKTLKKANKRVK